MIYLNGNTCLMFEVVTCSSDLSQFKVKHNKQLVSSMLNNRIDLVLMIAQWIYASNSISIFAIL